MSEDGDMMRAMLAEVEELSRLVDRVCDPRDEVLHPDDPICFEDVIEAFRLSAENLGNWNEWRKQALWGGKVMEGKLTWTIATERTSI